MTRDDANPFGIMATRRALWRHKGKALMGMALILAGTAAAVVCLPRTYESEAKLVVRLGRSSVRLDPTATTGEVVAIQETREHEINSILEILRSRSLAEQVVGELGPERILEKFEPDYDGGELVVRPVRSNPLGKVVGWLRSQLTVMTGVPTLSPQEEAVKEVERALSVDAAKLSSVVSVRARAETPWQAQQIVATLVDRFCQEHVRINQVTGSHEFFQAETESLHDRLQASLSAVTAAKNEWGIASAEGHRALLQQELTQVEMSLSQATSRAAASAARAEFLAQAIASEPERLVTRDESGLPNEAGDGMREELYRLEIRERELAAKYHEGHPLLTAVRQQLQEAKEIYGVQPEQRTQTTREFNTNRTALELALATEQADLASYRAEQTALSTERAAVLERLQLLNVREVKLAELDREAQRLEGDYRRYAEKQEQARIEAALDRERISNVAVFQGATLDRDPVSPSLLMLLGAGSVLSVMAAIGLALTAETLDHSIKSPEEVEQELDVPVLVSVPHVPRRQVSLN